MMTYALGYQTYVVLDATGQIDPSTAKAAAKKMTDIGIIQDYH